MDEDIFEAIKKQQEFAEQFPDYPCAKCKTQGKCFNKNKGCYKWLEWFGREWRKIRKKYGIM